MKKLLILAYDFPPYVSVGGLRPNFWYNHLASYGVYPVVVTRQWGNHYGNKLDYVAPGYSPNLETEETLYGTLIRTPYKPNLANRLLLRFGDQRFVLIRRFISGWYELMQYIFLIGPKSGLYRGAKQYLKHNKVDAIIATGNPFILFRYAAKLSRMYGVPWIADYRDPWVISNNQIPNFARSRWYAFFERRYMRNVKCITTVSSFFKTLIEQNLPGKRFKVLPNGYDPEAIERARLIEQGSHNLSIALVGHIYPYHPWKAFLRVCNQWLNNNPGARFRLDLYGNNIPEEVEQFVATDCQALESKFTIHAKTPNHLLMPKLANANLFLLFNNYSVVHTKFYEFVALKRRIMLCFTNDEEAIQLKALNYPLQDLETESSRIQEELINQTRSGINVTDRDHLYRVLDDCYREFEAKGFIECNPTGVEQFSRLRQVEQLAKLVEDVCNEQKMPTVERIS